MFYNVDGFNAGPRTTIDMWILGIDKDSYFVNALCEKDSTGECRWDVVCVMVQWYIHVEVFVCIMYVVVL